MKNVNKSIGYASFRSRLTLIVQHGITQYIHNSTNYKGNLIFIRHNHLQHILQ